MSGQNKTVPLLETLRAAEKQGYARALAEIWQEAEAASQEMHTSAFRVKAVPLATLLVLLGERGVEINGRKPNF